MAEKLYHRLRQHFQNRTACRTFGILDPVQAVQSAKYLSEIIYISGWQSSSTCPSNYEPGPDFADYPSDTIPNQVKRIFKSQEFHDRKHLTTNPTEVDHYVPIIADADTGFGGTTSVMKLTKMLLESGAAGLHLEYQRSGSKRCGHLGGNVLVSIQAQIDRLIAAHLQADIMDHSMVMIARTDAEKATFLDNNIDYRDHPFILGKFRMEDQLSHPPLTFPEAMKILARWEGKVYQPLLFEVDLKKSMDRARRYFYTSFTFDREDHVMDIIESAVD